ncbi:LptA/OstA family protein [Deinococcus psychrotolerans]|uniref:LptA/OstA family protein n=1 Tax=Deinococcus psychrotolerans TaxID=2489213 RepID=UPI0019D04285|nr:OstA family protein [Deinococcus psychrotolerans]
MNKRGLILGALLLSLAGVADLPNLALAQSQPPSSPALTSPTPPSAPPPPARLPAQTPPTQTTPADPAFPAEEGSPELTASDSANPDTPPPDPASLDGPDSVDSVNSTSTDSTPADPSPAADQEGASVTLTRKAKDGKQRVIKIVRTGLTDDTGIFASCTPQDSDPPGSPTESVFSETGPGGIQVTVDKNLIRAPLALVTQQEGGDGHIEMSAGTAQFLDEPPQGKTDRLSRCAVQADSKPAPDTVFVNQGRTNLKGKTLVYDESDGVARIDGPITFDRAPAAGKSETERLTGTSERIDVNVDNETTTLVGTVVLKNAGRVSKAARVDYDDAANVAILRGSPDKLAESVNGEEVICALVIRYNLDLNTVLAEGQIGGQFPDDGGSASSSSSLSGNPTPVPASPANSGTSALGCSGQ